MEQSVDSIERQEFDTFIDKHRPSGRNKSPQEILFGEIYSKIIILWGHALTKPPESFTDNQSSNGVSLFIWDESHAAQTKGMRPDKFFQLHEIFANEKSDTLEKANNNYVLSVSATPFAELCNSAHENDDRRIVTLENGDGYIGVNNMMQERRIISYHDIELCLETVFVEFKKRPPCYGIVRCSNTKNSGILRKICKESNINCIQYNSSTKSDIEDIAKFDATMQKQPETHTIIVIKGMLRMGKEVHKEHVHFCMETATNIKTDTILQGLIGRMCGYHSYNNINVYIHRKIYESDEIDNYITMISESRSVITCMPQRGANLVSGTRNKSELNPIIPIFVNHGKDESLSKKKNRSQYIKYIRDVFAEDRFNSINSPQQNSEIKYKINNFVDSQLTLRYMKQKYIDPTTKIADSWKNNIPKKLGSSFGAKADGSEIVILIYTCDFPEFGIYSGDIYVDARTVDGGFHNRPEHRNLPKTTGKEIFYSNPEIHSDDVISENENNMMNEEYNNPVTQQNQNRCRVM